jgi:preprotein translocase subunit SecG
MPLLISLTTTLNLAQILISVMLSVILLLQAKGSGFGAALGGSTSSVFRTRRGVEKTLFQLTIVLVVIFLLISLWSVRAA